MTIDSLSVAADRFTGLVVGTTCVCEGAWMTPLQLALYPLRMTQPRLVATDLAHCVPLSVVAGSGYWLAGKVDGAIFLNLLPGSLSAVWFGRLMARRTNGRRIQLALVWC